MALEYSGTIRTSYGSGTDLDNINQGTYVSWSRTNSVAKGSLDTLFAKGKATSSPWNYHRLFLNVGGAPAVGDGNLSLEIARNTTNLVIKSDSEPMPTANKWYFHAAVWNTGGIDLNQKLFVGDLTTTVVEVSSYDRKQTGTGTVGDDSADDFFIGNDEEVTFTRPFEGHIAFLALWKNRNLSLGEIQAQQFHPRVTKDCVLFTWLGFNGTSGDASWCGSNASKGSHTGTPTVQPSVPIGPAFAYDSEWPGAFTPAAPAATAPMLTLLGVG